MPPPNAKRSPAQTVVLPTEKYPFQQAAGTAEADVAALKLQQQNYEAVAPIGSGGMGAVIQVRDRNIERMVAMKVVLNQNQAPTEKLQRFLQEARIMGQLEHPNIVPIHELGIDKQGRLYYTMKMLRGRHLRNILEGIRDGDEVTIARYPLAGLLTIFQKVCDAVAYAHSKGIIHRDLKPENVMIGDYGEVVLMDWGLAKCVHDPEPPTTPTPQSADPATSPVLTQEGSVMGTPHFLSPEQANGRTQEVDERTDIFALGGMLYNILTLHPPYPGTYTPEIIERARVGAIAAPASFNPDTQRPATTASAATALRHCPGRRIPETLAAMAMKALAPNAEDRYQTVADLARDLQAYEAGFVTSVETKSVGRMVVLLVKRRKMEFLVLATALVALLTIGGVAITRVVQSERHARFLLEQLRQSAPAFVAEAQGLIEQSKFVEALQRIDYALSLDGQNADYHALRGNILQTQLSLGEAHRAYNTAIQLQPNHDAARENLKLCQQLLEENRGRRTWRPESLNRLHAGLLRQQRSAEALAIMRQFGADKGVLYDSWKTILATAGVPTTAKNLILNVRGLFSLTVQAPNLDNLAALKDMPLERLFLAGTKISDLSPLAGAPLVELDLTGTKISDLTPLTDMPLRSLILRDTAVNDLAPLSTVPLQNLALDGTPVQDLGPLQTAPLKALSLRGSLVDDLTPLRNLPLEELNLEATAVTNLAPLQKLPLKYLSLAGCEKIADLKPLADCRFLEVLILPAGAENHPVLKSLPALRVIRTKPIGSGPWPVAPPLPTGKPPGTK
jgi:serine/threonine protein kinase